MKRLKRILLVLLISLCFIPNVNAKEKQVNLYLFYSKTCPHCAKEKKYLEKLEKKYSNLKIHKYEISEKKSQGLYVLVDESLEDDNKYVPYTIIGTESLIGFNDYTQDKIEDYVEICSKYECYDLVSEVKKANKSLKEEAKKAKKEFKKHIKENKENYMKVPLLGKINVKRVSLPVIAFSIGLVDGFNPCAMWVLIFLISMLLGMKNRKRMWIIGLTFLFISGLIYLLFMMAWLGIFQNLGNVRIVQVLISIVAIIGSIINFNSFNKERKKDAGCQVVNKEQRKNIIHKIRKFTTEKSLLLALLGVISLAISVNIVELACTAGLPALFTQILVLNKLSTPLYMLYMIIYIIAYMLDDIIVFSIAMITLKMTGITNKYNKYSHLIGGIIMLVIGLLMLIKPEWIMMNF